MERSRELEITYIHSGEDDFTLSIPDYDTEKSDVELTTAANAILTAAAFEPNGFTLESLAGLVKVVTTEETVDTSGE